PCRNFTLTSPRATSTVTNCQHFENGVPASIRDSFFFPTRLTKAACAQVLNHRPAGVATRNGRPRAEGRESLISLRQVNVAYVSQRRVESDPFSYFFSVRIR